MRLRSALAALLLGACAHNPSGKLATPVLLRFVPPERGGPTTFPEANPSGVLDLSGPCVRLELRPGHFTTVVSSANARVGRDWKGPFLQYGQHRFRHGAEIEGGGGHSDSLPTDFGLFDGPVPEACSRGPFLILVGIEPYERQPPPKSPPPPPVG
jgi:hypothetical protein